ncbi:Por secretion system C-terminal sorting domain-containing protein [Chryseolinea serpens]|uniref:Por secretion system C-terminal sorting domain-containing protein n=1 Tax=Chryseolinea serpens TaxID=947013 RepID=A0A1M5TT74_9BACT|nr:T9SS type A sorting domain-containing protein [Chryseolinea serpens]SHH53881.1 Por secretion system C-terminal sorting domain-containing protein [Chryseolinea serpens]
MKNNMNSFCRKLVFGMLILTGIFLSSPPAAAQWSSSAYANNAICTAPLNQDQVAIASDGSGGAIMAWTDYRGESRIYAQRIDANGLIKWTIDGIAVSTSQSFVPAVVEDGSGGVIITWVDLGNGNDFDIYAQRLNGLGQAQWPAGGILVSASEGWQTNPVITTDGQGGALIAWIDDGLEMDAAKDVYIQRVTANGSLSWPENNPVTEAYYRQEDIKIISDKNGGAILAWTDYRNTQTTTTGVDVYAQRINATGGQVWETDGVGVAVYDRYQQYPQLTSDGSGGAIIVWEDDRDADNADALNMDIYGQRINATGNMLWTGNGMGIGVAPATQSRPVVTGDGAGGAIIAWQSGSGFNNAYASYLVTQRVNSNGAKQWASAGVALGNAGRENPQIVSDGDGGAIIAWEDYTGQAPIGALKDIFAQRLDASGQNLWASGGAPISNTTFVQQNPKLIPDGARGAIVTWIDNRTNTTLDIYAQRVQADGTLGGGNGGKSDQAITFNALPSKKISDGDFNLNATASSGLTVTYASDNLSVATVSGNIVVMTGVGTATITASQPGSTIYNPATPVSQTLTVLKGDQTIVFGALPVKVPGDPDFTLQATASSGLSVSYTSSNGAVATVSGNTVTVHGTGTTVLTALQAGNANYTAAPNVMQTLTVKTAQSISFPVVSTKTWGDPAFALSATATSGLAVVFSSTSDKVSIVGSTATLLKAGSVTVFADQPGNTTFAPAPRTSQTFCINPAQPIVSVSDADPSAPVLTSSSPGGNQWFKDGQPISNATQSTLTVHDAGTYSVVVTIDNCQSQPSAERTFIVTGIEDPAGSVNVYPNPMHDQLVVDAEALSSGSPVKLNLYDAVGRVVHQDDGHGKFVINVTALKAGLYVLKVSNGKQTITKKLLK